VHYTTTGTFKAIECERDWCPKMQLLRLPKLYHPAYCRHEVIQENQFFNRWKLQEKYWSVHHPKAGHRIGPNENYNQESVHEIHNSRLKRFEKKLKLMARLNNYYGIFMQSLPPLPFKPSSRDAQIINMQVSCPSSRSLLTSAGSSLTLTYKSSLSDIPPRHEKRKYKNRNKRRRLAVSRNYEQVTTNHFFGDKRTIKIENINTRFAESTPVPNGLQQPSGQMQMGDFCTLDNNNILFELQPHQHQQQQEQNSNIESLLFTPICTSLISTEESQRLNLRLSNTGKSCKPKLSRNSKQEKEKRAKQLQIVQEKLKKDQLRETLEFHPDLDKDWLVINRELCEYKGKMTTLKRTIQYIYDDEITIHQSLERSFQHKKLQDSAQDISEFVKALRQPKENVNKTSQQIQLPSPFPSLPELSLAKIHMGRIAELSKPETLISNQATNLSRINSFNISAAPEPDRKQKIKQDLKGNQQSPSTECLLRGRDSNSSNTDDLWFARNYNRCESLERRSEKYYKANLPLSRKLIPRFFRHHYHHLKRVFRSRKKARLDQNYQRNNYYCMNSNPKHPKNLVII
jgi:hypothetical protein